MNQIGMENLCNGIVLQAVKDYRTALSKHDEEGAKSMERFFRSPWYKHLTNVDGEYLIEKIRKEYEKD